MAATKINNSADIDGLVEELTKFMVSDKCNESLNKEKTKSELKPKKGLTPYQGDLRTYGYFRCEDCHSDWSSAYSWADTAQKCELCKKFRFPYRQIPFYGMFKSGGRGLRKPHIQPSCGKCLQIRSSCTKLKTCNDVPGNDRPIPGLDEALQIKKLVPPKKRRNRHSKKNKKDGPAESSGTEKASN